MQVTVTSYEHLMLHDHAYFGEGSSKNVAGKNEDMQNDTKVAVFCYLSTGQKKKLLIPKTVGNRKRDCA